MPERISGAPMGQQESNDKHAAEISAEQRYVKHALACLHQMHTKARQVREISDRMVNEENTVDARIARHHLEAREAALSERRGPLCFGRIDTSDGERFYIGRRHVEDETSQPVVIDWRAPASAAFYRATAIDPYGLDFRRRFINEAEQVIDLIDEDLTDPESGAHAGLPDPLLAELERSRTGQMSDIVATIAGEQDQIIRAPLDELLIVQGGPGTGKTAVGLHRAAFLLFEHRRDLIDSRVLVIGPNPLFLRYVAEVLPSLGETAVSQATLGGLVASRWPINGIDGPDVARLKGSLVMAKIVRAAVESRYQPLADGLTLRANLAIVRFDADELAELLSRAMDTRLPLNKGREVFRRLVIQQGWRRHSQRPGVDPGGEPLFASAVKADADFKRAINRMWPTLSAARIVQDLWKSPRRLDDAVQQASDANGESVPATELMTIEQRRSMKRPAAKTGEVGNWTLADIGVLDEAQWLIDGVPAGYGHVVVDEAQDLSPMALRMLARRADRGSMTILGDLAQATTPEATASWSDAARILAGQVAETSRTETEPKVTYTELTVGYRVPADILDMANQLLPRIAPGVTAARSVRQSSEEPLVLAVGPSEIEDVVVRTAAELRGRGFSVAVVAIDERLDDLGAGLADGGIAADAVGGDGLPGADAVALIDPANVKGLEFDAVLVVEPAEIAELVSGLRHLYVALTRAVQHLGIVHSRPLPFETASFTSDRT